MTTQTATASCRVDSDGAVNLNAILNSFKAPMKEEHTWALCYQCIRFFIECQSSRNEPSCLVGTMTDVYLRTDGNVHLKTSYPVDTSERRRVANEQEIIVGLGSVLYSTLDHCYNEEEERIISEPLEELMCDMISNQVSFNRSIHETDDEGIERDEEEHLDGRSAGRKDDGAQMTLKEVLQRCEVHVSSLTKAQAECHYKAVVRALVTEALELSTFLDIVAKGMHLTAHNTEPGTMDQLQFMDWSSLWLTVISELRTGVKLKKVNYGRAPIEYELTPYEILMKDIRNYKQNLRKVKTENVRRHGRDIILEFIRSRPPLKKACERKLAPRPPKYYSPREQLMHSIRKGRALRKTTETQQLEIPPSGDPTRMDFDSTLLGSSMPNHNNQAANMREAVDSEQEGGSTSKRRLISVDFSQIDCDDDEFDNDDVDEDMNLWSDEVSVESRQSLIAGQTIVDKYDLAMTSGYRFKPRPAVNGGLLNLTITADPPLSHSVPHSRPHSRQSDTASHSSHLDGTSATTPLDQLSLDNRLSLTLEEIVHIRTVLTAAEIEALPAEASVRANVEARKVCFLCLKTKFSVFGPWGHRCILCQCTVCNKCSGRMRIPMEHFASVPVVLLSPNIMATPDGDLADNEFFPSAASAHNSGRSTPDGASAVTACTQSSLSSGGANSTNLRSSPSRSRPNSSLDRFRAKTSGSSGTSGGVVDRLRGETSGQMMIVCHDCRAMVLQIIRSAQANRSEIRNKHLKSMTLDLSPMF